MRYPIGRVVVDFCPSSFVVSSSHAPSSFAALHFMDRFLRISGRLIAPSLLTLSLVLAGCDSPPGPFSANDLYAQVVAIRQNTQPGDAAEDVRGVIQELFGTPDEPKLPAEIPASLVDLENLLRAAGPVSSDQQDVHYGVFRSHCVVCHGLDGSGAGPAAALQNPYPRDLRSGIFKYKSTARDQKPTKADLLASLRRGAPGSSMPAFDRLPEQDLEAVVDYVVYLSIRGEVERRLIQYAIAELGYGDADAGNVDRLVVGSDGLLVDADMNTALSQILETVINQWVDAKPIEVPPVPQSIDAASVERGRELFHGPLANCASCHGKNGSGDALTLDFDDWTKEFTTLLGISPGDNQAVKAMRKLGALPPRPISPRKLSWGVYRGGNDPETLYRRLVVGIAGTPMPGVLVQSGEGTAGMTPEQVWDLVAYLGSLARPLVAEESL